MCDGAGRGEGEGTGEGDGTDEGHGTAEGAGIGDGAGTAEGTGTAEGAGTAPGAGIALRSSCSMRRRRAAWSRQRIATSARASHGMRLQTNTIAIRYEGMPLSSDPRECSDPSQDARLP